MATRAIVGTQLGKGKYASVYTHNDGYPSHHLDILVKNYDTQDKVNTLLSGGDISILAAKCDGADGVCDDFYHRDSTEVVKHSFDKPVKDQTVYYGRDRGEADTELTKHSSLKRFTEQEYGYIFKDNEWFVVLPGELVSHSEFLKNDEYQDERQD